MSVYITQKEAWNLVRIFNICGLPRLASFSIARQLQSWEKSRGMEWVVARLKLLISDLLIGDQEGIAKRADGSWKGIFRPVYLLGHRGRRGLRNALRILRIYGRYERKHVGLEEFIDFCSSIQPPTDTYVCPKLNLTPEDRWLAKDAIKHSKFNFNYDCSPTKKSPIREGIYMSRHEISPDVHLQALDACPRLVLKHWDFLSRLFRLREHQIYTRLVYQHDIVGGVCSLVKDRGLKVRFIANPAYFLQVALSRLKSALEQFLVSMPESCVYNHERGTDWIRAKLLQGCSISSIDLSKCSDNLPSKEQFSMLHDLFDPALTEDIDLFESVSRSEWFGPGPVASTFAAKRVYARWTKGQPLGTNPSFACFTIFHILLVRAVGGDSSNFRVIGDDIVISDNTLCDRVLELYKGLEVEVSIHKSLFKNKRLAEFAGRLVDRHGILKVYKASPLDVTKDPLGYIRQYGMAGVKLLPKKLRPILWSIALLPKPYGYGKLGIVDDLPSELIYDLYVERFKPIGSMSRSEAFKVWDSAFQPFPVGLVGFPESHTRLGESAWVSDIGSDPSISRLEDHVMSWHGTPMEDIPEKVLQWNEELSKLPRTIGTKYPDDVYLEEPVKPISWVKQVYHRLVRFLHGDSE